MRKLYLFFITYFFFLGLAFAQPANDDPANAIDLTVNSTCTTISATNVGATDSGAGAPGCASYNGGDVWFKFTVPATGKFTVDTDTNGGFTDSGMALYSGTPGALILEGCDDDGSPNGLMSLVTEGDLTNPASPGDVLYVRVWNYDNNTFGTFLICAFDPIPPTNDEPAGAIDLPVGQVCNGTTGTNAGASASEVADPTIPAPGCANYSGGDVWYKFTVPATGDIILETSTAGGFTDSGMALYSGTPGAFTFIECDDFGGPGSFSRIEQTGLTPGDILYVRVWEDGNNSFGEFNICAFDPPAPANDEPTGAIDLSVSHSCNSVTGTNVGANASEVSDPSIPAPGCANYSGGDIWYKFTVPATGDVIIETSTAGGFTDSGIALYSGTPGAFTFIECDDFDGPGSFSRIEQTGLTPGDILYVRVWEDGNNSFGEFNICVTDNSPPPNDDPINAIDLTVGRACSNTVSDNFSATDSEVADPSIPAPGCADYSGGDVWFKFTVPASGNFTIISSVNGGITDSGMAVYSGSIGSFSLEGCNDDINGIANRMSGLTGTAYTPGDILYIRMWEYGNNVFGTFNICVKDDNPGAPMNDEPVGAINLDVGTSCSNTLADNADATASEVADPSIADPSCSTYAGGDVWFTFTVPASGDVTITTDVVDFIDGGMAIYSGNIGSLVEITCDDDSGPSNMPEIVTNSLTPGDVIYVRVWEFGNNSFGGFNICVFDNNPPPPPPPPANDNDTGATALNVNTSCSNVSATNVSATSSEIADPSIPAPGCGDYQGGDVWFTAVIPPSRDVTFALSGNGGITDASIAIYTGTPGSLALAACRDGSGGMPSLTNTSFTAGSTVYIRAWENGNDVAGTFNICVVDNFVAPPPPPPPPPPVGAGGGGPVNVPAATSVTAPTNLTGIAISSSQINLTWNDNSDNEDGFRIYKDGILIATIAPNSTTFSDSLLNANTFYNYKVEAFNSTKHSTSNTLSIATLPLSPSITDVIGACGESVAYIQMGNAPSGGLYRFYNSDSDSAQVVGEVAAGYFATPVLTQTSTFYVTVVIDGRESTPRVPVEATVSEAVVAELAQGGTSVVSCDAQTSIEATTQTGATYQWSVNGTVLNETSNILTATKNGNYALTVSRANCSETLYFKVELGYQPEVLIEQGNSATFCDGGSLSAGNTISGATYEWLLAGTSVGTGTSTTVSESGVYTLKVTENGCVNTTTIQVNVFSIPNNQTVTASATQFCKGESITLSVPQMTGVSYQWYSNNKRISGNKNSLIVGSEGEYEVEMFVRGLNCVKRSSSVSVSHFDTPEVELTRDDKTLNLDIPIAHQSVEWFTTGGVALPQFTGASISPEFGTYWAVITYPTGCSVTSNSIRFFEENPTNNGGGVVGIEDEEDISDVFEVFPNPSHNGVFYIKIGTGFGTETKFELNDALGRSLNMNFDLRQQAEVIELDLTNYAKGIYYLQLVTPEGLLTKKLIKQ